jgi:hypothetical protein
VGIIIFKTTSRYPYTSGLSLQRKATDPLLITFPKKRRNPAKMNSFAEFRRYMLFYLYSCEYTEALLFTWRLNAGGAIPHVNQTPTIFSEFPRMLYFYISVPHQLIYNHSLSTKQDTHS